MCRRVPKISPSCLVTLLGIVTCKGTVPVEDCSLTVHTLFAQILICHGLADTVEREGGIARRTQHSGSTHLILRRSFQIIALTGCKP